MVNLSKQIGVRISHETYIHLTRVSKLRGEDLSDFVRRAIYKELADLSFLPDDQKKALGIKNHERIDERELNDT